MAAADQWPAGLSVSGPQNHHPAVGMAGQPISIRLPVNAVVEFTARVVKAPPDPNPNPITVAGRIFGRYWYSEE